MPRDPASDHPPHHREFLADFEQALADEQFKLAADLLRAFDPTPAVARAGPYRERLPARAGGGVALPHSLELLGEGLVVDAYFALMDADPEAADLQAAEVLYL